MTGRPPKHYHFLEATLSELDASDGVYSTLIARKGPFVAILQRDKEAAQWSGRLLFGMPDADGLVGSPTLLGIAKPHQHLAVVLSRLSERAHEVNRATIAAVKKQKRKKHDYRTPKKRT